MLSGVTTRRPGGSILPGVSASAGAPARRGGRAPSSSSSSSRALILGVVLVLLAYVGLAAWFAYGILAGRWEEKVLPGLKSAANTKAAAGGSVGGKVDAKPLPTRAAEDVVATRNARNDPNEDIHIVFSTGCNLFQHYQAEMVAHSFDRMGHKGKLTRVVSGCDTEHVKRTHGKFLTHPEGLGDQPVPLEDLYKTSNSKMSVFVTPSFEGAREFPWINKPMGLAHWLANAKDVNESVIVIIDPDEFFMGRMEQDGKKRLQGSRPPYAGSGLLCSDGCKRGLWRGTSVLDFTDQVKEGRPVAQTYGLGGGWIRTYDVKAIAGESSPMAKYTSSEAHQYLSVGPPMAAHVNDLRKIMQLWTKYMYPVFNAAPGVIEADMYAYSIASGHLNLPHLMMDHFMVSSPGGQGEAWPHVKLDDPRISHPCSDPNKYLEFPPTFLHVAQRYDSHKEFMFHKGHVPPNILTCELPLVREPPEDLIDSVPITDMLQRQKNYMLCNAYKVLNEAVTAWKLKFCPKETANFKKDIMLQKRSQNCRKEESGKTCWIFARVVPSL